MEGTGWGIAIGLFLPARLAVRTGVAHFGGWNYGEQIQAAH